MTYGLKIAEDNFAKNKCKLITLTNLLELLETAIAQNKITEEDYEKIVLWSKSEHNL